VPPILHPEEERKLIEALDSALQDPRHPKYLKYLRDALAISLGLYQGLRIGETTHLLISHVLWSGEISPYLFIPSNFWKRCIEAKLPWHPTTMRLLKLWIEPRLKWLPEGVTDGFLLVSRPGNFQKLENMSVVSVFNAIHVWAKVAGIRPFKFHLLRHTYASTLVNLGGAQIADAQAFLRHRDIRSTLIYQHSSQGRMDEIYKKAYANSPPVRV
jgi:integrase